MKISTDCPRSDGPKPIPPLSQSRHGDMAREILYVRKHVQYRRVAESEAAPRGSTKLTRTVLPSGVLNLIEL